MAQMAAPQAIAEYRCRLQQYLEARAAFEQEASAYWTSISENGAAATPSGAIMSRSNSTITC